MSDAAPFLLTKPDFSKMQVVKAYDHTVVAPAIDYWRTTIDKKTGAEVARLKVARIFNPLHVLGYQISVSDIDSLKILRLTEHPLIMPHIDGMKSEIIKYQALARSSLWTRERTPRAKTLLCCLIGGGATLENFLTLHLCCARC